MNTENKPLTFNDCYHFSDDDKESYEKQFDAALAAGDKEKAHKIVRAWIHRKE